MILNETVATKPDWISLQGKTLEGGYELGAVLEAEDAVAHFRARVLGDAYLAAYASMYVADGAIASEQLQVWHDLRKLQHPNLKTPLSCGRLKVNGVSMIYVICSMPDETLSEILGDRGLTEEEGAELLKSLGQGLQQLHSHGFAHGALSPEMAVAVGERIQISTECVRRINARPSIEVASPRYLAPEVTSANVSMGADVWCLGATVFESLVQKKYEQTWYSDLGRLGLGGILQRCLDSNPHTRARLNEIVEAPDDSRFEKLPPNARVKPVKVTRKPVEAKKIRPLENGSMDLIRYEGYGLDRLKTRAKSRSITWRPIVTGIAALVLIAIVIWLVILPKLQSISDTSSDTAQQPKTAWPTNTVEGSAADPDAHTQAASTAKNESSGAAQTSNAATYRFVIGDYEREQDADRRIEFLNKVHPELNVKKFSKSPAGPFYVISGGLMTQSEANELRRKALDMGIARTSYVADLSEQ